jgi:hypothetical protein
MIPMKSRKPKEKFNCVYCGKSTATFCGYWKLISVGRYELKNKSIIDSCYAHLGCYLERHRRIIQLGVHPLAVYCEQIKTPKQAVEILKIHGDIKKVKNTIKFLQNVVREWESSQTQAKSKISSLNKGLKTTKPRASSSKSGKA